MAAVKNRRLVVVGGALVPVGVDHHGDGGAVGAAGAARRHGGAGLLAGPFDLAGVKIEPGTHLIGQRGVVEGAGVGVAEHGAGQVVAAGYDVAGMALGGEHVVGWRGCLATGVDQSQWSGRVAGRALRPAYALQGATGVYRRGEGGRQRSHAQEKNCEESFHVSKRVLVRVECHIIYCKVNKNFSDTATAVNYFALCGLFS